MSNFIHTIKTSTIRNSHNNNSEEQSFKREGDRGAEIDRERQRERASGLSIKKINAGKKS